MLRIKFVFVEKSCKFFFDEVSSKNGQFFSVLLISVKLNFDFLQRAETLISDAVLLILKFSYFLNWSSSDDLKLDLRVIHLI